ncbi:MAG TPA: 30S ribosomal protein S6 [Pyrinomonadaceae bacterium]|nr:30S ribosomal protein S6 [Pyrinomonadaceae bacterium]
MANQRTYEVMYIVDTEVSTDDFTRLSETLQQIITEQGGTVTKTEDMGRRQLAYPISHKNEGHYMLLEIDGTGHEIAELERRMRVNDQIVRYLTVRVDEDRQRAEKFKAKRARKASKRPVGSGSRGSGRNMGASIAPVPAMAEEDLES